MSVERSLQPLFTESEDLRGEYTGVEEVYPDTAVVTADGDKFHRPAAHTDELLPACIDRKQEWKLVDTDEARRGGFSPCRACFGPILDYLAREADSDVERRGDGYTATEPDAIAADGGLDDLGPGRLTSKTEDVLVASGSKIYHAPSDDGPYCNSKGDFRRVDREVLGGFRKPCSECFDLDG